MTDLPPVEWPVVAFNQNQIAGLIAKKFLIRCVQQDIVHWRKGRGIGDSTEVFPAPDNGRYNVAKCFDWAQRNVIDRRAEKAVSMDEKQELKSVKASIEKKKDKLLGIKIGQAEAKLINRGIAERTCIGVIKKLLATYRNTDEKDVPRDAETKLQEIGVSIEHRAQFKEWLITRMQAVTTQRETSTEGAIAEIDLQPAQTAPV